MIRSLLIGAATVSLAASTMSQTLAFRSRASWPHIPGQNMLVLELNGAPGKEVVAGRALVGSQPGPALSYWSLIGNHDWAPGNASSAQPLPGLATYHRTLASGDIDGDGDIDVFVGRTTLQVGLPQVVPEADQVWLNDGAGNLQAAAVPRLPSIPTNASDASLFDVDADGDLDLALCGLNQLWLFVNDGAGHFSDATHQITNHSLYHPWRSCIVDANHDGHLDLFVTNGAGLIEPSVLYRNDGTGHFTPYILSTVGTGKPFLVDANSDGYADVFCVYTLRATLFLSQPGQPSIVEAAHLLPTLPAGVALGFDSAVIDYDGDGDLDIVGQTGATGWVLWEQTAAGFSDRSALLPAKIGAGPALVVDYDVDGDDDLFMGYYSPSPQVILPYYLSNTQRDIEFDSTPTVGSPFSISVTANGGHAALLALSTGVQRQFFPELGILYLNPSFSATIGILSFPARGTATVSLAVPPNPGLAGMTLCAQAADLSIGSGEIRLTTAPTLVVQ